MARNLFSKGTNSARSSNDPSSKQKQPQIESSIRVSNKRPNQPTPNVTYPCQLCPKVYPSIHALRGHQNAHKRDKLLMPGIQLVVDFSEFELENHVEPNPAPQRGCDSPNCHRRYRALRMRAINHHSQPRSRARRAHARPPPCTCPPRPVHPNRNQGNQRYVAPRRTVSIIPPPPPPSPTYTVTLVPTQVTINEWVPPTTRRQPPPPPPPPVVEPKVKVVEVSVVEPKVEVEEVPVVEPKVEVYANVVVDDNSNGLDLELRL